MSHSIQRRWLLVLAALAGLEATLPDAAARADTVTVCRTSCDFRTIQEAIDAASPGDVIRIGAGTYTERLQLEKDLTLEGEDPRLTIIDGGRQGTVALVRSSAVVKVSAVTITHGTGSAGGSTNDGGGIHNSGTLTLTNCILVENDAPEDVSGTGRGGGIRNDGNLEMIECTLSGNTSAGRGGGVFNTGTLVLLQTTVCGNTARGGGGIFNEGELTVRVSALFDNRSSEDGGGILNEGTSVLTNSTLSENKAAGNGGGISVRPGGAPVAPTTMVFCTVSENDADDRGSGIFNGSSARVVLEGSIIAKNEGTNCSGEMESRGYNIDGDDSCDLVRGGDRPDRPNTEPLLGQLGYNGGKTLTHALQAGSPAIDAAGEASCAVEADQRGLPRPAGTRCDIGAYERPTCEPVLVSVDFTRGDVGNDAAINLTDAVSILNFLFLGGSPLTCVDAGDADDDGRLLVTDAIFLLNWLFLGGPPPLEPVTCGSDPTADDLGCEAAAACTAEQPRFGELWTSSREIEMKPTSGEAWEAVWKAAQEACSDEATVANQDSNTNVQILAAAIAYSRLRGVEPESAEHMRRKVIGAIEKLVREGNPRETIGCPEGCGKAVNETLAWGREAGAYVLAADLVGYRTHAFEAWCRNLAEVYVACDGRTMVDAFEKRPNNWGVLNFGSLVAIYAYLGDEARLADVRSYFIRGLEGKIPDCQAVGDRDPCYVWGGDRDTDDKDMTWHCDPSAPSLIAPSCKFNVGGSEIDLDGLIPDDQRRSCSFCPPGNTSPTCANAPEERRCVEPQPDSHITDWMTGAVMGARILDRIGMPIWASADQALKRMLIAHMVTHCQLTCDDDGFQCESLYNCKDWIVPVLDEAYGLRAEFTPPPPTDCSCPFELEGRGFGASKNAGFGAYIVR